MTIKRFPSDWRVGPQEFKATYASLSHFKHPNIVNLLGLVGQGIAKCLVYEFFSNESLRDRLDGKNSAPRLKKGHREFVALGIATAMNYLQHFEPRAPFFHLNLKSTNVLLQSIPQPEYSFQYTPQHAPQPQALSCKLQHQPKLFDFGFIRPPVIGSGSESSVGRKEDFPHICPQYLTEGKVSRKTDVYSYGCLLIELFHEKLITTQTLADFCSGKTSQQPVLGSTTNHDSLIMSCINNNRFYRPSFASIIQNFGGNQVVSLEGQPIVDNIVVAKECLRCSNQPIDAKFSPCNHAVVCQYCAQYLKNCDESCPVCYTLIKSFDPE